MGDRGFESFFLQRGVRCELALTRSDWEAAVFGLETRYSRFAWPTKRILEERSFTASGSDCRRSCPGTGTSSAPLLAMTASHKAICCFRVTGTAGGGNADEVGGVLTPADPTAAGRDCEDLVTGQTHHPMAAITRAVKGGFAGRLPVA
jgi:hypothetical protein